MSNCAACYRLAPDGHHACPRCADDLRGWLDELPHQARLLAAFVLPAGRTTAGRIGGTGRAHAPVPVDLRVLELLGPGHPLPPDGSPYEEAGGTVPILPLVRGWADYIASEHQAVHRDRHGTAHLWPCDGAHPGRGPTVTGWCAWLTAYLPYAVTQPWVGALHRQIGGLIAVIRDFTHAVPHRHPQGAPCPSCDAFALVRTDGQWHIACEACGHRLEPDAYEQHAAVFLAAVQADQERSTA